MGFYEELGVRTVINASGTLTRLGGSRMAPEIAGGDGRGRRRRSSRSTTLQARAGEIIAEITGAEAGYVVTGAAAGFSLGVAACVAGMDVAAMDRLPDTTGLKNEVVVQRGHRNAYDHAIRAAGVRMVEVGYLGYPGAGGTYPWQIAEAITSGRRPSPARFSTRRARCRCRRSAASRTRGACRSSSMPRPSCRRGRTCAASSPRARIWSSSPAARRSRGPQASGILAGRADLIASVALQHQDMDVRPQTWSWRPLLDAGHLAGVPHQGFGRSMKVGREEIVGLLTALRRYAAGSDDDDLERWQRLPRPDRAGTAQGIPGVTAQPAHRPGTQTGAVACASTFDGDCAANRAYDMVNRLLAGDPAIAIDQSHAEHGRLSVNPQGLTAEEAQAVARRLREECQGDG